MGAPIPVEHPYDIPYGVGRGRVLGDPVLLICATVLLMALIAAVVVLSVTNHSSDVRTYVSIISPVFSSVVVLLGLGKRTGDVHAQSQATYQRLNGELDKRIVDAVTTALATRRQSDPGVTQPATAEPGV